MVLDDELLDDVEPDEDVDDEEDDEELESDDLVPESEDFVLDESELGEPAAALLLPFDSDRLSVR